MTIPKVYLKKDRERSALSFHPWIFSGAIDEIDDSAKPGDLVSVHSSDKSFLGIGYFNPQSQITVRILTFANESIDQSFFQRGILQASELRKQFLDSETNCYRLINAEGDFLPGLIVDRYGAFLVVQFQTLGMDLLRPLVLEALSAVAGIEGIYERSDVGARGLEGLQKRTGLLSGTMPPDLLQIKEHGNLFYVDIKNGQKTGFFLDQRENRRRIGNLSKGRKVLNCFSYSGGFSVYAACGGAARVTSMEASAAANELCCKNYELNHLDPNSHRIVTADVFEFLRKDQSQYDLAVVDPPAFCKSRKHLKEAARGYKDINMLAMKRLAAGGLLFTSSCSNYVDADLFQKILFAAAKDIKRNVQLLLRTDHSEDHPVSLYHPEGSYLKGMLLRIN